MSTSAAEAHRHMLIALPVTAHDVVAFALEPFCKVRGNEPSSSSDTDSQLLLWPIRLELVLGKIRSLIELLCNLRLSHPSCRQEPSTAGLWEQGVVVDQNQSTRV